MMILTSFTGTYPETGRSGPVVHHTEAAARAAVEAALFEVSK